MSNTLWVTLRTRDKFQLLDQTERLGGKLSSASANFLDATSAVFSDVFNSTYETLNTMVAAKSNIANQFMDVTTNFVSRTGNLVSSWLDIESSMPSIQSDDQKTTRSFMATNLLNQSIDLINATQCQLAKVINATSILLNTESSMEHKTYFVDALVNSTARILSATTDSLGKLLDSTNHLIEDVVSANQETAVSAYNATTKLLNATSETVTSFLKATTLLITDAANSTMLDDGGSEDGDNEPTIRAMHATKHVLSKIFNSTTTLMQGVINKHKYVAHHVVDTTGNFLEASMDVKSNIFTKTINFGKNVKKATVHLLANKLQSAANKLVSALDHMEQHFEQSDSTQSQSQSSSPANDAHATEAIPPELITPVEVQTEPIIQIDSQSELQVTEIGNELMQPTVDGPAESVPSVVSA